MKVSNHKKKKKRKKDEEMKLVFGIAVTFGFHSEMVKSEFPVDGSENIRFDIFMGMKTESRVSNK